SICGGRKIEQDPDVLDTWFSSWLWPFSTMGWPEETKELDVFYPTDALVTAPEIIFFWVARMIMAGLKFQKDIPFKDVYIHGTVRDATGTKMSKSLGNVIDPLDVIKEVGSDALRFSIISITAQGQDVFLSRDKFELGRNFANKLWNASRYVLMNLDESALKGKIYPGKLTLEDKWILSSLNDTIRKVEKNLEAYRFNDVASVLYDFIWHKYCDWYLEISKLSTNKEVTQEVLVKVLKTALCLLHPIMPFITEEIWSKIPGADGNIMVSEWPKVDKKLDDKRSTDEMEKLIAIISAVRNVRAFWNIELSSKVNVLLSVTSKEDEKLLKDNTRYIERLARCSVTEVGRSVKRPDQSVAALAGKTRLYVPLEGTVEVEEEKTRINKKVEELEKYLKGIDKKLSNKGFLDKAPEDVVKKEEAKRERFSEQLNTLKENLAALK
ncbi:MAG: class I tRNA ligase family protein, partial [Candidatus Omnitrophica bacterium]|nr:class I tRNA ligase family protein [Candidatus Omnitrophota bacterium]